MTKYRLKSPVKFVVCIVLIVALITATIIAIMMDKPEEVKVTKTVMLAPPAPKPVETPVIPEVTVPTPAIETKVQEVKPLSKPTPKVEPKKVVHSSRGNDISAEDLELLAHLIHCEAGIDTMNGKLAVGTVVMNRMKNSNRAMFGGPTLKGVVYHKLKGARRHQFSCVDDKELWSEKPDKEDYEAARKILSGFRMFRSSFVYYYNPDISKGISGITCDYEVGMHIFGEE